MKLPIPQDQLLSLLDKLAEAVEDILATGLTTASAASKQTLNQAFQEASRLRLLRLGSTLRVAAEEMGRFAKGDEGFSVKRLTFFLNRAWMLSKGLAHAIRQNDEEQWQTLTWNPPGTPVAALDAVTIGVSKRVAPGAFCAFEFRLRTLTAQPELPAGSSLIWSCVFPMKAEMEIPPEGFLHLSQPQKFKGIELVQKKQFRIEKAMLSGDSAARRLLLTPESAVTIGEGWKDWQQELRWEPQAALERLKAHQPGPFDLDIELQEEIVLNGWSIGKGEANERDQVVDFPLETEGMHLTARVAVHDETLLKALEKLRKLEKRPPLYGVMHYEMCRFFLQPLTVFDDKGPDYISLTKGSVGAAALLKSLKF